MQGAPTREKPVQWPVVAVVGVTASGKSALAMELAEEFSGEIICADSRTVHRELAIGAAKPSELDQARVRHHLLDVVDLDGLLTAPAFAVRSEAAIEEIASHRKLPLVVGGTQLFVNAALFDCEYRCPGPADWVCDLSLAEVYQRFTDAGLSLPLNWEDRSILERAWSANHLVHSGVLRRPSLLIGVRPASADALCASVRRRVALMLRAGLEEEVRGICLNHQRRAASLFSIGYEEWDPYFAGAATVSDVVGVTVAHTLGYAARQQRWLDSLEGVCWVDGAAEAAGLVHEFLSRVARAA